MINLFRLDGEDVSEIQEIPGFTPDEQTLFTSNLTSGQMLQITEHRVNLVDSKGLVNGWKAPEGKSITLCSVNCNQIMLAIRNQLLYLEIEDSKLVEKASIEMQNEIACIDISPLDDKKAKFCAVGLWNDISVRHFSFNGIYTKFS